MLLYIQPTAPRGRWHKEQHMSGERNIPAPRSGEPAQQGMAPGKYADMIGSDQAVDRLGVPTTPKPRQSGE